MRAARLHEYTDDPGDALRIDEVERPTAADPDDVVVDVEGAGWCRTDNHVIEGLWTDHVPQSLPLTLGHENAGTVAEVGDGVTAVEVGDPVVCHPARTCGICLACRRGEDMYCENLVFPGLTADGGFADYLLTGERAVLGLPAGVDPVDVAPHADAGITAYHAAKRAVRESNPGEYAVVIGVGGLGHIGVQVLDAMSALRIVAIDVRDEALSLAADLGAAATVNPTEEDVPRAVYEATDGNLAAQVLDFVGSDETTGYATDVLGPGGDHHVVGYGGHVHEPTQSLVNREVSFVGTLVGRYAELQELVALVEAGDVTLQTTRYDLDEINEVAQRLERGDIEGRAVIIP